MVANELKTLVVLPAFNEAENIVSVVEALVTTCPKLDYIIVNDGSYDETYDICVQHGYPALNLVTNLGLAGAFTTGMRYAYEHDYDAVIQFDSDGQHKAEYLDDMIAALQTGSDIVCGSRFVTSSRPKSMRMMGSVLISLAIRATTGVSLKDPTSGLRAYCKWITKEFATQFDLTPEPDTISYLIKQGASITEIAVTMNERIAGKSYLTAIQSIKYMLRMGLAILIVQPFRKKQVTEIKQQSIKKPTEEKD